MYRILFGLGLVSIVLLVVIIAGSFGIGEKDIKTKVATPIESGFRIFDQRLERSGKELLVSGKVENEGPFDWEHVFLNLKITSGDSAQRICTCSIPLFRAQEIRVFKFSCNEISLDKNANTQVTVINGFKLETK